MLVEAPVHQLGRVVRLGDAFAPDGVIAFYEWDFDGDGVFDVVTADPTTTYTYPAAFSGEATLRVTDERGLSAIAMAQVEVAGTTVTPTLTRTATATATQTAMSTPTMTPTPTAITASVIDDFNRANGVIGASWTGSTSAYGIDANQLVIDGDDAAIFWATPFGTDQEVSVTLSTVDTASTEIDLLLKAQDSSGCNVLEVWYQPARGTVEVWTCTGTNTWVQHGSGLAASFSAGDRLGARVTASGIVTVLKNGTNLGSITVASSWPYLNQGGMIGLWNINSTNHFDDFAGGTVSSGAVPRRGPAVAAAAGGRAYLSAGQNGE
ncbi:PKD domain-containing protein [Chloroflexales bacterium ZM16-3]|nr:PKD domain-containing protein [Chloroflexales bacterium ZM16-3]